MDVVLKHWARREEKFICPFDRAAAPKVCLDLCVGLATEEIVHPLYVQVILIPVPGGLVWNAVNLWHGYSVGA